MASRRVERCRKACLQNMNDMFWISTNKQNRIRKNISLSYFDLASLEGSIITYLFLTQDIHTVEKLWYFDISYKWVLTNDQVLLVTGGYCKPNYIFSTDVSLQHHKVKLVFRTNFLNLYLLSYTRRHQFVLKSKSKIFWGKHNFPYYVIQLLVLKNAKRKNIY